MAVAAKVRCGNGGGLSLIKRREARRFEHGTQRRQVEVATLSTFN